MNAPIEPAHSPFGGSVATRVLRCPASVKLVESVPDFLRKTSSYAQRGNALHSAMTLLIDEKRRLDNIAGEIIETYSITPDDVETALRPVLAYVDSLINQPGAEFYLEKRVAFPTVPGAFGTVDLLVRINDTVYVVDYKFGSGVRVLALYPEGDEDVLNGQLMFYAAAARHSLPKFFASANEIILVILQPVSIEVDAETISVATVTPDELDAFATLYRTACEETLSPSPRLEKGAHCRFCPAKPICPAHTGPLLDLAQLAAPAPLPRGGVLSKPADREAYLRALADGLNLLEAIKDLRVAFHDQAKHALDLGHVVPGYTLSAGRNERRWRDAAAAYDALIGLGLERDDIIAEAMRSPAQTERRAKACGLKIPPELIVSTRSGTSLMRIENARSRVLGREETVRLFSEALEALQEGSRP